jgi:hypothetical protein
MLAHPPQNSTSTDFHPPYEDEREFCGDCLALLENTSLAQHISDSHTISCDLCQLDFSRVAGLINHCLRKHTLNFLRTLNDSNRNALFAASKTHATFLSHENAAPNIPVSGTENKNLPSLFSDDFSNILRGAGFMGNPLYSLLKAYNDGPQAIDTVKDKWIHNQADTTLIIDCLF